MTKKEEIQNAIEWIEGLRDGWNDTDNIKYCNMAIKALEKTSALDKAIEHYEGTLETLKDILEVEK